MSAAVKRAGEAHAEIGSLYGRYVRSETASESRSGQIDIVFQPEINTAHDAVITFIYPVYAVEMLRRINQEGRAEGAVASSEMIAGGILITEREGRKTRTVSAVQRNAGNLLVCGSFGKAYAQFADIAVVKSDYRTVTVPDSQPEVHFFRVTGDVIIARTAYYRHVGNTDIAVHNPVRVAYHSFRVAVIDPDISVVTQRLCQSRGELDARRGAIDPRSENVFDVDFAVAYEIKGNCLGTVGDDLQTECFEKFGIGLVAYRRAIAHGITGKICLNLFQSAQGRLVGVVAGLSRSENILAGNLYVYVAEPVVARVEEVDFAGLGTVTGYG